MSFKYSTWYSLLEEVGFIKQKLFVRYVLFIIITCILFITLNFTAIAEEDLAEISIKETPTYKLLSQNTSGNIVVSRYKISITFENKGNIDSEKIKVNLTDTEGFVLDKIFKIDSMQTKVITFNWSTILTDNQQLQINYGPEDLGTIRTKYNSGKTTLTIKGLENNGDGSSPGYEIVSVTFALLFSIVLLKYRKKKY